MEPLSIITSTIALVEATSKAYQVIRHLKNLPKEFAEVKRHFPVVEDTLRLAQGRLRDENLPAASTEAIVPVLKECQENAKQLKDIFFEVKAKQDGSFYRTFLKGLGSLGKGRRVETLMQKLVKGVQALALNDAFRVATENQVTKLQEAIDKLASVKSSVPDSDLAGPETQNVQNVASGGTGNQANNTGSGLVKQFNGGTNFAPSGGTQNFGTIVIRNDKPTRSLETQRDEFSVPFSLRASKRVETFIGREKDVAAIHDQLQEKDGRRVVAIHGLGGMGKTQLSLEYVRRYKKAYSAIFCLNANDRQSIQQSFVRVAKQIHQAHPSACALDAKDIKEHPEMAVEVVCAWLSRAKNTKWLLIYDNYDNPKVKNNKDPDALDLCDFIPEADHGSVLITTRVARAGIGHPFPIGKMDEAESFTVLSTASGRAGVPDDADAKKLVAILDGLPLALASAGAYLRQVQTSFKEYLGSYKENWSELQRSNHELDTYDFTLYTAWQLSYKHVQNQNILSANLLRWWAYFDNRDVWFELFRECNDLEGAPLWMRQLTAKKEAFDDAVRVLVNHGLIEKDNTPLPQDLEASSGYSMHACVHAWTFHILNAELDRDLPELAMFCVAKYCAGEPNVMTLSRRLRVLHHAQRCVSAIPAAVDHMNEELYCLGNILSPLDLSMAETAYQRAYDGLKTTLGPENESTREVERSLADVYKRQGKHEAAKEMLSRALSSTDAETTAGPERLSTLLAARDLGEIYLDQAKYAEAEKELLRALSGLKKAVGPDSSETLHTVLSLGKLRLAQGKYDAAKELFLQLVPGIDMAIGQNLDLDLPIVNKTTLALDAVCKLGEIYVAQEQYEAAEEVLLRAQSNLERTTAPGYYSALVFIGLLGTVYLKQGRLNMFEETLSQVLPYLETAPRVYREVAFKAVEALGHLYAAQGKHDEARGMFSRIPGYTPPDLPSSDTLTAWAEKLLTKLKNFFF